jgi:hypothetical protein
MTTTITPPAGVTPPEGRKDEDARYEYLGHVEKRNSRFHTEQVHIWGVRYRPDALDPDQTHWRAGHVECVLNRVTIMATDEDFGLKPLPDDTGTEWIGVKTWQYLRTHAEVIDALLIMARRWCADDEAMRMQIIRYAQPAVDQAA